MTSEQVHEAGAKRHKDRWLYANQRAVEAASAAGMSYHGEKDKLGISLIVLKVLDGQMLDTGFLWSKEGEKWIPRVVQKVADRLMGVAG